MLITPDFPEILNCRAVGRDKVALALDQVVDDHAGSANFR
jgi:hypothetical protein